MRETFFQLCVYFMVCMIAVSVFVSIIAGFGFFGDIGDVEQVTEVDTESSAIEFVFRTITGNPTAGTSLWSLILLGAGILGGTVAILGLILGGNSTVIGVFIFGVTFWASYGIMIDITKIANLIPSQIIWGATVLMALIFIGAVIGLLTGNG